MPSSLNTVIPPLQRGEGVHEKRSFRLGNLPPKGRTTNFSFLALADSSHWRDRAASVAGRLAAGVGSRVAVPRSAACPVGSTQLANQIGSAVAQRWRVCGCAVAATKTMGGRGDSRHKVWRTNAAQA